MKITSSILLLLLVSAVCSLSLKSHDAFLKVESGSRQRGEPLGTLIYTARNYQPVSQTIFAGDQTYI